MSSFLVICFVFLCLFTEMLTFEPGTGASLYWVLIELLCTVQAAVKTKCHPQREREKRSTLVFLSLTDFNSRL